jgi:hypothetical protein
MGKSQRTKGAVYEREIVDILKAAGYDAARNLQQTRDGGGDIIVDKYLFECKRRARLSVYEWMDQASKACDVYHKPVVVTRADRRENLAILNFTHLLDLIRELEYEKAKASSLQNRLVAFEAEPITRNCSTEKTEGES